jgi:FkbM family methyltransferase
MLRAVAARSVFSAKDEVRLVGDYLSEPKGTFVEVGAYQPIELSQTYALEQRGWSGILIEPVPEHAAAIRAVRSSPVFEVACGAPEDHGKQLPIRVSGGLSTMRSHDLTHDLAAREPRNVPVVTLDSVLEKAGISSIDFLSIDVEGMEIAVLRGFSIERYRPRLALIEDHCDGLAKHRYMRSLGYKLVRRSDLNSWYVPESVPFPISLFGRWQLLRKYYLSLPFRRLQRFRRRKRYASPDRGAD